MVNYKEQELKTIIKKIAKKNGFSDESSVAITDYADNGGFMGEMLIIHVAEQNNEKILNLVAKISFKDESIREVATFTEYYVNEINTYENLVPAFRKLQAEAQITRPFDSTPKFYDASSATMAEYVILENLKASGYHLLPLRHLLDHEHTKLLFEKYGEFHALSFALKTLKPQEWNTVIKGLKTVWDVILSEKEMGKMIQRMLEEINTIMKNKGLENKRMNHYVHNIFDIMKKIINNEDKYTCYLHGDCWSNNLMFKYEATNGEKKLQDVKMIDFQSSRVGPPVHDLMYILYSGASKEVLDNLDTYLRVYHERLTKFLSYFKLDVNSIYPFHEIKRQWKNYCDYGGILGALIWKVRSTEEEKILQKSSDDGSHYDEIITADCNQDYLCEHIKILCDHLDKISNGDI